MNYPHLGRVANVTHIQESRESDAVGKDQTFGVLDEIIDIH